MTIAIPQTRSPRRARARRGGRPAGPARRSGRRRGPRRREQLIGLGFLVPALTLFVVFVVYPIVYNLQASTLDWDGVNTGVPVGLGNYQDLFADSIFHRALKNSSWWILLTIVPQAAIGLALATQLNQRLRGRSIYRALFFLPAILSPVVVGIVWQRIMDPFNGVLAEIGRATGVELLTQPFLSDPDTAIFAVVVVNVWMWSGFSMLFYLAGLQLLDESVMEAAKVDGAGPWRTTWHLTIPMLRNTHLSLLLLGVIGSLKTFELVYVLTEGGPNHASEMLPTYAFQQAFQLQNIGYASTISVVLLALAVLSSLALVRVFGRGFITGEER